MSCNATFCVYGLLLLPRGSAFPVHEFCVIPHEEHVRRSGVELVDLTCAKSVRGHIDAFEHASGRHSANAYARRGLDQFEGTRTATAHTRTHRAFVQSRGKAHGLCLRASRP